MLLVSACSTTLRKTTVSPDRVRYNTSCRRRWPPRPVLSSGPSAAAKLSPFFSSTFSIIPLSFPPPDQCYSIYQNVQFLCGVRLLLSMLLDFNIIRTSSNIVKLYQLNSGDDVQFLCKFPQNSQPTLTMNTCYFQHIQHVVCHNHLCVAALFISWSIIPFVVSQPILSSSQTKTRFRSMSRIFSFDDTILVPKFSTLRSKPNWC